MLLRLGDEKALQPTRSSKSRRGSRSPSSPVWHKGRCMRAPRVPLDARPKLNPLDNFALCLASVCLLVGGADLLYVGVSNSDVTQTVRIMGWVALLSLVQMVLWVVAKRLLEWREAYEGRLMVS